MSEAKKPLPDVYWEQTREFWEGCRRHELWIQRCSDCGTFRWYPRHMCHVCNSANKTWTKASGNGKIYSWTVVHHPSSPAWAAETPYVVAVVELEEGVRMASNIVDCLTEKLYIGMPVEVIFESVTEDVTLYKFKPAS
ncbi:MAG: hypothetical protein COS88_04720 [Chloroflexi bacterium CG07_land_8_20_14_0_80_51_10]|nr:MAG: hypothetical protein COS88_04720 [Chloroflexi bacterium CG07_land_8_20_14_0_80_51_10]